MIHDKRLNTLFSKPISWVLLSGCLLRLYSAIARGIINRDGGHYIHQAQAIFSGQWSDLVTCDMSYVTIYPFFIAAANVLFHDWVVSGVFVNVVFGCAALFPLYFLLRRFANDTICAITMLVYALLPTFVNSSGDIVRGPVFWFFISLGMLMFIRQWDKGAEKQRYRYDLIMSSLFYILAACTRIEGAVFIATSIFYLLITRTDRKFKRVVIFLSPFGCIILLAIVFAAVFQNDVLQTLRAEKIISEVTQFGHKYEALESQIKTIYSQHTGLTSEFLHRVQESLWIVPFAILFHNIVEVWFYPFALIYFIGFIGIRKKIAQHQHMGYLMWLTLASFIVLYVHLLHSGVMIHRFFAILILPSCLLIANGVETSLAFMQRKYRLKRATAIIILVGFFSLLGLPKVLKPKEKEGILYRQAAQLIANSKPYDQLELIASAYKSNAYGYIFLYAHRKYPQPLCTSNLVVKLEPTEDYDQFVTRIDSQQIRYLLYEERYWPTEQFDFLALPYQQDFNLLGEWQISGHGKIMLFDRVKG